MRLIQWFDEFRDDVKFAVRQMRSAPVFTCIAAITLALGIGGNSAIFALVDAALLRPLPFPEPGRLVMMWERSPDVRARRCVAAQHGRLGRARPLVGGHGRIRALRRRDGHGGRDGTAETVPRQWVTANFFAGLGVKPVAGRMFLRPTIVRTQKWPCSAKRSGVRGSTRDPSVIGRVVRLDGTPFTVVGVAPNEAQLMRTSIWALVLFHVVPRRGPPIPWWSSAGCGRA